jgi:D-arabinose 1-dehydrogenase-like Zn-dependent alcohol dehydrogenase
MKEGLFPGIQYPRVPGHEIAGIVDAVGDDLTEWKTGHRVAVGWPKTRTDDGYSN